MTLTAKLLLAYLVLATVIFGWMFRYDMRPSGYGANVFILDRWTGKIKLCSGGGCFEIERNAL